MNRPLCAACRWAEADARDPFGPFHAIDDLPVDSPERVALLDAREQAERAVSAINGREPRAARTYLGRAFAALRRLSEPGRTRRFGGGA